jgi:hypothetical protein
VPAGGVALQSRRIKRDPLVCSVSPDRRDHAVQAWRRPPVWSHRGGGIHRGRVAAKRDITLRELREELRAHGVRVSIGALWRFFDRRQITLKKTAHAAEQKRADVNQARADWRELMRSLDPRRLICLDESGAATNIMDDLPAHKVSGARKAIEAAGAPLLYPPAYSPDLNPIEMVAA